MKKFYLCLFLILFFGGGLRGQDYFLKDKGPFLNDIPSPEEFLGYPIGAQHTRHDQIVAYLEKLSELSDRAQIIYYGQTYEYRKLVILQISTPSHLENIETHQAKHLEVCDPQKNGSDFSDLPVFINLGYNVHGNESSGGEAALLSAYVLVASNHPQIQKFREESIVFVDPTINPDGRDRHSSWANTYRGRPLVSDPLDAEHNEAWPRGRTNHYWFDLNRDWILGIHPESRGKLNWYHEWYPNVVTDFHEMGTNSTYFFEPMKDNASQDPIMPKENYTTLNDTFGKYYARALDSLGSFYFTKEVFDGTYPGYGSSYPDLQGGLGILFEQASSRGHLQETSTTPITFAFTIRNQFATGLATVQAAVENKNLLYNYQKDFFQSAIRRAGKNPVKAYVFGDARDANRNKAFIDKLLLHRVKVYRLNQSISRDGKTFESGEAFVVPTQQPQYRMVQTFFETYDQYRDSVFYDASAWSLANFYNMPYAELNNNPSGEEISSTENLVKISPPRRSEYAYVIPWEDYNAMPALYYFLKKNVTVTAAYKPFQAEVEGKAQEFSYGTLVIPVKSRQKVSPSDLFQLIQN
ncbi:MAG: M14 family zinc carboxypeptidase, partial [Bacteroidota bacterium]